MMCLRRAGLFAFFLGLLRTELLLDGAPCFLFFAFRLDPSLVGAFLSLSRLCSPRTRRNCGSRTLRLGCSGLAGFFLQANVLLVLVGLFLKDTCPDSEAVHGPGT